MNQLLNKELDGLFQEMVEIRRHLHQHPELSFQEVKTPALIAEFHQNLGHEVRTNVGSRGVVATLKGAKPGKTIALRADFDALPIQDAKDVSYKSTIDGVMHACGHDGHTATLLCLAKALNKIQKELSGTIVFIHQHAEEYAPGGAIEMIKDGCLDGVDYIFGTHLWATEPLGKLQYCKGPVMAAADRFEITIHGQGGHGAQPHLTKDAIVVGSQLVMNLQQLVSRKVDPLKSAVLSIGSFDARNAFNVIANSAKLIGTVRTFDEGVRDLMEEEIKRVVDGTCLAADVTADYEYIRGYPAVVNHDEETDTLVEIVSTIPDLTELEHMTPQMGGEDFAYYLQHVKGSFFFIGARNPEWQVAYPHHHPRFDIDERSMLIAAKALGEIALHYTNIQ
ncbi:M20 metallopeptidase family protein [Bacillus sp. FJAT-45350]|uniref:M20 metallopeptidase family protein n=1 Tax=Bacillus sp. FJAT-45350 TaxID=2011014 RepID=UPI0015CB577E|nr:M20 family metallopeptidase [Bacillus sp. FJAT-45350]